MKGTMLWFDEAKDYGFVLSGDGERLYVDRDGFVDGAAPVGRCAGRPVNLSVVERDGEKVAVDVSLVTEESPRRARRRSSSIRAAWP
jgi:cold shock CspA family protein